MDRPGLHAALHQPGDQRARLPDTGPGDLWLLIPITVSFVLIGIGQRLLVQETAQAD